MAEVALQCVCVAQGGAGCCCVAGLLEYFRAECGLESAGVPAFLAQLVARGIGRRQLESMNEEELVRARARARVFVVVSTAC
jgi:hypothetical protein